MHLFNISLAVVEIMMHSLLGLPSHRALDGTATADVVEIGVVLQGNHLLTLEVVLV